MKIQNLGLIVLAAVALIGTTVIAALGHPVAGELWLIDGTLVGAAAGVTVPSALGVTTAVAAAPAAVQPVAATVHVGQ
jgi:hypothetical protein